MCLFTVCQGGTKTILSAGAGLATQRWHPVAAALAGIEETTAPFALAFNTADSGSTQMSATVQEFSCKLGRIEDLVQELDSLRLNCPALASVTVQGKCVQLVFLGLEAELKFTVQIEIGKPQCMQQQRRMLLCWLLLLPSQRSSLVTEVKLERRCKQYELGAAGAQYPYGPMPCQARIQLQQADVLTADQLERAVAVVASGHGRLTKVCHALGSLTKTAPAAAVSADSKKELYVFSNPLFGAT